MTTSLDILGGISAVVQILQTAIDIANRIKSAKNKKGLTMVINQNRREVDSLKDILRAVKEEKALQTKTVVAEVAEIADLGTKLEDLLKTMEDANFMSKFMHGNDQQEELRTLTGEIAKAKSNLTMKIQNAHVGLTVLADNRVVVQMEKLESIDANLKRLIIGFEGLSIGEVVKGREPTEDGTIPLDESDLEQLGLGTENDDPYQDGSRIIDKNMAFDQSLMINGTIGTEGFIEPKHVRIFNNVSRDQATMINASIAHETWEEARADRLKIIETMASHNALGKEQAIGISPEVSKPTRANRMREGRAERSQARALVRKVRKGGRSRRRRV